MRCGGALVFWLAWLVAAEKENPDIRHAAGLQGSQVRLRCGVVEAATLGGRGQLESLKWRRNGAVVASFQAGETSAEWWVSSARMSLDRATFSLLLGRASSRDSGAYRCHPVFAHHHHWSPDPPELIRLDIIGPPGEPGRPWVRETGSRSLEVAWSPPAAHRQGPVTKFVLLVSQQDSAGAVTRKWEASVAGNATATLVEDLQPYTSYEFQVAAENLAGRSELSPKSQPSRTKGEAPSKAPRITSTRNGTRPGEVAVEWRPPPPESLHGPVVGWRLMAHKLSTGHYHEFYLAAKDTHEYTVSGLDAWERYMVSVAADNNFGYSPTDTAFVRTQEGRPDSPPRLAKLRGVGSHVLRLYFAPPLQPRGRITKYSIYYRARTARTNSSLAFFPPRGSEKRTSLTKDLTELAANSEFLVWASAWTRVGEGPASPALLASTDVGTPRAPLRLTTELKPPSSVRLGWESPPGLVSFYALRLWSGPGPDAQSTGEVMTSNPFHTLDGLAFGDARFVSVKAVARSRLKTGVTYESPSSRRVAFVIRKERPSANAPPTVHFRTSACPVRKPALHIQGYKSSCDVSLLESGLDRSSEASQSSGAATGVAVASALLCLGVLALLLLCFLRRRGKGGGAPKRELLILDEASSGTYSVSLKAEPPSLQSPDYFDDAEYPSVPVEEFETHVNGLSADSEAGFAKEFLALEAEGVEAEATATLAPENKPKNRYVNILAYDHSRVVLRNSRTASLRRAEDLAASDYINANFVDGYRRKQAYIATQGPLPSTFGDFWRMVYEQRTMVIVMITNVVEKGRKKCEQYWPSSGAQLYGDEWEVRLLSECRTAFYTLRMLSLRQLKPLTGTWSRPGSGGERIVWHWHYRSWPDHGVPDSALPLISFVKKSAGSSPTGAGPVLVHCSAGVGRSGCYMLIESAMREAAERRRVSLAAHLRHIRRQRNFLVQTEEQYVFCHQAVLELIRAGTTTVEMPALQDFVAHTLRAEDPDLDGRTLLAVQHEQVTRPSGKESFTEALRPVNVAKNRSPAFLPDDHHRVLLNCQAGVQGSDYVNASLVPGYHSPAQFIVTQVPLLQTQTDFWRMVWESRCQTVALLCPVEAPGVESFWPTQPQDRWRLEGLELSVDEVTSGEGWTCLDLRLEPAATPDSRESILDESVVGQSLQCRLLHYPAWAEVWSEGQDSEGWEGVWELVETVAEWHLSFGETPLVVVDEVGGGGAGAFALLCTALTQSEEEGSVDLYAAAKLLTAARPGLLGCEDELGQLYDAVAALAEALAKGPGPSRTSSSEGGDSGFSSRFKLSASLPSGFPRPLNSAPSPPSQQPPADPHHPASILKRPQNQPLPASPLVRDTSLP